MRFVGFKFVGGNVAYGGDLAMAEFVGDRKYYTAINSPSLWKSKDAIRVKQALMILSILFQSRDLLHIWF